MLVSEYRCGQDATATATSHPESTNVTTAVERLAAAGGTMFGMPDSGFSYVDTQAPGLGVQLIPARRRVIRTGFVVVLVAVVLLCVAAFVLTR
jgi:hypothetical protein